MRVFKNTLRTSLYTMRGHCNKSPQTQICSSTLILCHRASALPADFAPSSHQGASRAAPLQRPKKAAANTLRRPKPTRRAGLAREPESSLIDTASISTSLCVPPQARSIEVAKALLLGCLVCSQVSTIAKGYRTYRHPLLMATLACRIARHMSRSSPSNACSQLFPL